MITLEDGAILAQWNDSGFWYVSAMSADEASKYIEEANAEWNEEEEEEAEED